MAPVSIHGHVTINNCYLTIRYRQIDIFLFIRPQESIKIRFMQKNSEEIRIIS